MPGRPTLVFADDNRQVIDAACTILGMEYNVLKVAVDGEDAVRWISELKPDFAVLDISMPKLDGIGVARLLRQTGIATRVVFVSLIQDDDFLHEAQLVGHGYVLKRRLASDLLPALASARHGLFFCSH
jgi:DNA-binding NarL/FixJ family response regulator